MSNIFDQEKKNSRGFHKNSDGSWGTDDHDGELLKGLAAVITAIGSAVVGILSTKKNG